MTESVLLSWSGGKDSALVLHELVKDFRWRVTALLTTVTEDYDRTSMHGVRRVLLEEQAAAVGLPLEVVFITAGADTAQYERRMRETLERRKAGGTNTVAIGDLFLEDLRKYREDKLAQVGMSAVFPIWGRDTVELAHTFIRLGFRAVLTCVDTQALDRSFAGREYDERLLAELPEDADPCGENGEFHTFVYDGPVFGRPVGFTRGDVVLRDNRFCFCDLLPTASDVCGGNER